MTLRLTYNLRSVANESPEKEDLLFAIVSELISFSYRKNEMSTV